MPCAWITHRDCQLHEMGDGHPECPERLDAISDHLLAQGLMSLLIPYDAPMATVEQLERAHTARHVTGDHGARRPPRATCTWTRTRR